MDGASDDKLNDYGIAVEAGSDGNGYIVGYSLAPRSTGADFVQQPVLIVLSPTGKSLLRHTIDIGSLPFQRVTSMQLVESSDSSKSVYVFGESKDRDSALAPSKLSISGAEIPADRIPIFAGFDDAITAAGAANPVDDEEAGTQDPKSSFPMGPVAGGVIGLIAIGLVAGVFVAVKISKATANSVRSDIEVPQGSTPSPIAPAQLN